MDFVSQFRDALQNKFGLLEWLPIADGKIHRFRVPGDKPSTLGGWYLLSVDERKGCFGSLSTGGTFSAVSGLSHAKA